MVKLRHGGTAGNEDCACGIGVEGKGYAGAGEADSILWGTGVVCGGRGVWDISGEGLLGVLIEERIVFTICE